ncbi:WD40-repeat-containing domain protein [Hypoxylon crocopeplum]|nr:WD40-repeat-containing domain protein [Hypoxylon crocopeplum]
MKPNAQHIVQSLKQVEELSEVQVRVLITSRNESHIDTAFKNLPEESYDEIELRKVSLGGHHDEKDDITIFFEIQSGPSADDFRKLVEKAGGLFIYAATACKFLEVHPDLAKRRLEKLLKGNTNEKSPESTLNQIYSTVLESYTRDWADDEKQEDHLLKEILGLIVVLFLPLPICSLAEYTKSQISAPEVEKYLKSVRSVIDLPKDPKASVGLVHLSFREFLLDEQRYLVQERIPPYLQYACRYWVDHLLQIGETQRAQDALADDGSIHNFLRKRVLNWLEALSLIREVGSAVHMVSHLESLASTRESPELSKLLHDANRFILFNRHIIQGAPLQLYYSAILFSPTTSVIRSLFSKPEWIIKTPTVNDNWGAELLVLEGHQRSVNAVAFSPDGKTLVSGSDDGTARLWEAATGTETAKIDLPRQVNAVAFSSDGRTIALGTESGLRLYDVGTGEILDLSNTEVWLNAVAFSPCRDSKILATITIKTLYLWDISTKQQIRTHEVPDGKVVAFTPNGNLVAAGSGLYCSKTGAVHIWDVKTGELTAEFNYSGTVESIAFSPDGVTIASATDEGSTQIRNIESGDTLDLLNPEYPSAVTFSPDGGILAIGSRIGMIHLWNLVSGEEIRELRYHTLCITGIAFSPNGKTIASASYDKTIRLCDITASDETKVIRGGIVTVEAPRGSDVALVASHESTSVWDLNEFKVIHKFSEVMKVSPDGKIAASLRGPSVQIWDMTAGERLKHFKDAHRVDFSPDSEMLALISEDSIQILEIATWKERAIFKTNSLVSNIQFSTDNATLSWLYGKMGKVLGLYLANLATGDTFYREHYGFSWPTLSLDGTLAAFKPELEAKYVHLLQVNTQEVRAKLPLGEDTDLMDISFSPDSTRIATIASNGHGNNIILWDTITGNIMHTLQTSVESWLAAIAPDGKVAVELLRSEIFIWDPVEGERSDLLRSPGDGLSFSEDSKYLYGPHGRIPLSSSTKDFGCLYVDGDWVLQGGERLLWLPQAYRSDEEKIAVRRDTIVLEFRSGSVTFIKIDLDKTPLAKQQKACSQVEKGSVRGPEAE